VLEPRLFRRICYEAARRTGGTVAEFRISDEQTPNFHQGIVAYPDRAVAVVCVRDAALHAPFDPRQWPGISSHDLRHGNPGTLGEALFNYWD
jgi:hypothetical protein